MWMGEEGDSFITGKGEWAYRWGLSQAEWKCCMLEKRGEF
jgi:hypothetical protein